MAMRIMVTGATGLLGQEVVRELRARGHECLGVSTADFDLRDAGAVRRAVQSCRPQAIVHCAAWTAVDLAESEPHHCAEVNAVGTLYLARAARDVDAKLLYISTDYVFDGSGDAPHEADERTAPLNVYGLSKLQGEEAIRGVMSRYFILRTSWVFGKGGPCFVGTMLRLGRERQQVSVVRDQAGAPTYAPDLAALIADMIVTEKYGVYHASNEGSCTFAELAQMVMRADGSRCRIQPITTEEYGAAARRPRNSCLSMRSLDENGFRRLPPWENALHRYLDEMKRQ